MLLRHQHSEPIIAPAILSPTTSPSPSSPSTSSSSTAPSTAPTTASAYKDGTYTGSVDNAFYGNVQVSATIAGGKITAVNFLQYPDENPNSIYVNTTAIPYLKQEAIKAQSSNVSVVSGATFTSQAFMQSLANALGQAKQS
jgi:uncharacterized protein with FMN-binding domain